MVQKVMLLVLVSLILSACGMPAGGPGTQADGRLHVVVTTGQLADAVQNIAGDRVRLSMLLGPGIDPHTYVPTESDITLFQDAQVILYNGLRLEAQMERVLAQIGQSGRVRVVAVADQLPPEQLLNWEPEAGYPHDPHVWNDVELWQQVVGVVRDTLIAADAPNAEAYRNGAAAYLAQLEELHTYVREQAASIPAERRILVSAHDAFGYFGRAYGFEVEAIQGISTESEASAADIQALTQLVVERNVRAIFVETTISPRTIEAVQEAVRAQGREVQIGGQLYSDALGDPGTPQGTYIGMMRHNIDTIVNALKG